MTVTIIDRAQYRRQRTARHLRFRNRAVPNLLIIINALHINQLRWHYMIDIETLSQQAARSLRLSNIGSLSITCQLGDQHENRIVDIRACF